MMAGHERFQSNELMMYRLSLVNSSLTNSIICEPQNMCWAISALDMWVFREI